MSKTTFSFTFSIADDPCPTIHEPDAFPGGYVFVPVALFVARRTRLSSQECWPTLWRTSLNTTVHGKLDLENWSRLPCPTGFHERYRFLFWCGGSCWWLATSGWIPPLGNVIRRMVVEC